MNILIFILGLIVAAGASAQCTLAVTIDGAITAATKDYLERAAKEAEKKKCSSILVRINTPGGELQATRRIIEKILASPLPFLCLVTPSGGHAGSAGALILQGCHINGGLAATNLGAATPILGTGENLSDDLRNKMVNDTVSWSQGLAKLRGRNEKFAKDIVSEAKAISSEEAHRIKALDIYAQNEAEFLEKAKNFKVQIIEEKGQAVQVGPLVEYTTDIRFQILNFVSDPELAYLLFMASLALLYFEITHPGLMGPGVLGAVGLVLSLIAFHKLEVQWGGLALILLGISFLVAEVFIPSFGILGIGGIASLIVGSFFLYDIELTGYSLPWALILSVSLFLGAVFMGLGFLALKTLRQGKKDLDSHMIGKKARVVKLDDSQTGLIEAGGELWKFSSQEPVAVGEQVIILNREGLRLKVQKSI